MSRKIPFNSLFALIGFLFSIGSGLVFFSISYEYSLFPIKGVIFQIFFIVISLILGIGMIGFGMWLLEGLRKKESIKTDENERLLKAIAKKLDISAELVINDEIGKYKQKELVARNNKALKDELATIKTKLIKMEKLLKEGERSSVNQVEYSIGFASLLGSLTFVSVKANPWAASFMALGGLVLMVLSPYIRKKRRKD